MKTFMAALKIFLVFTLLTGIVYPLIITGIAQVIFPCKANGSMIIKNDKVIGSELIGQNFDSAIYFSSRPSAISYNPLPSGGSNYSLTNDKLKKMVMERRKTFATVNKLDEQNIPSEMFFASASGLDPHISPEAALMQVDRVARARDFNNEQKEKLRQTVLNLVETPQFHFFGEYRINVLLLNLETDKLQ
jgi:potassium-transporting ATPase KdpC subunit